MLLESGLVKLSRKIAESAAFLMLRVSVVAMIGVLGMILFFVFSRGIGSISWEFLMSMPKNGMTEGGILPAIVGTCCLVVGAVLVSVPLGVLSAIYTTEYARQGPLIRIIRMATNNLSGVPSVVFGLFGMVFFVRGLNFGPSILAGSLTLALVALPVVIRSSEEALKTVPMGLREASVALGATRWQTISKVVLPSALSGILTGTILTVGRVAGETAPILFTVAAYYLPRLPHSPFDQVMALPYHLYVITTSGTEIEKTRPLAYGTAVVLLTLVLLINMAAIIIRNRVRKKNG
ncbi:MAG: phosphate ABC transporter permease PstA [Candidatus Latescibacterota bacterium]